MKTEALAAILLCTIYALPSQAQGTAQPIVTASYWEEALFHGSIGAYMVAAIEDGHVTKVIIDNSDGSVVEGNPLPAWIIEEFGTTVLEAWKVGVTVAIVAGMEALWFKWGRHGGKWERVAMISMSVGIAVLQAVVVRSNVELGTTGTSFLFNF